MKELWSKIKAWWLGFDYNKDGKVTGQDVKDAVDDVVEDVKEKADEIKAEVKSRAKRVKEELDDVKSAAADVVDQAGDIVDAAKGKPRRGRKKCTEEEAAPKKTTAKSKK